MDGSCCTRSRCGCARRGRCIGNGAARLAATRADFCLEERATRDDSTFRDARGARTHRGAAGAALVGIRQSGGGSGVHRNFAAVMKGGIVMLDPDIGIPHGIIVLQYNPDTLTRTSAAAERRRSSRPVGNPAAEGPADRNHQRRRRDRRNRPAGRPADNPLASLGIQPQLSALETWSIRPVDLIANEALTLLGTIEILPMNRRWRCSSGTPPHHAGAHHRLQHHRGGLRHQPQSDSRQGDAGNACAERQRLSQSRRSPLHGLSDREGGSGDRQRGSDHLALWRRSISL